MIHYQDKTVTLHAGDCLDILRELPDNSVDAVVTDPPYGLEFMGKEWDSPWKKGVDVNVDAGFTSDGMGKGFTALPSFTGSTNPKCSTCKGTRRGRRDGTADRAVCLCVDGGKFPNVRAAEMRAFGAWCELWVAECLRVLKPGGHLLAFGGTRTWHRLAVAIEDAGFEMRDSIAWLYGSGFPKSLDVSKAIDKAAGATREVVGTAAEFARDGSVRRTDGSHVIPHEQQGGHGFADRWAAPVTAPATDDARRWQGWGTALKPAFEPVVVARKPLAGTVAANVLAWGTGALNIDATRVGTGDALVRPSVQRVDNDVLGKGLGAGVQTEPPGRWPANVVLDEDAAAELDLSTSGLKRQGNKTYGTASRDGASSQVPNASSLPVCGYDDEGGASRFFPVFRYQAKAPTKERPTADDGTKHATVKPLALMRWLVRLVTPPGSVVLEPFAGSGTTVEACLLEGFRCIAIEREASYLPLIEQRIRRVVVDPPAPPAEATLFDEPERPKGRWPANVILDRDAAAELDEQSGISKDGVAGAKSGGFGGGMFGDGTPDGVGAAGFGGSGGASRFFTVVDGDPTLFDEDGAA